MIRIILSLVFATLMTFGSVSSFAKHGADDVVPQTETCDDNGTDIGC